MIDKQPDEGVGVELKPCPWCGAAGDEQDEWGHLVTHKPTCYWTNIHGDSIGRVRVLFSETEQWNTRTPSSGGEAESEDSGNEAKNLAVPRTESKGNVKSSAAERQAFDDGYLGGVLTGHDEGFELGYKDGVDAERERCGLIADLWGASVSCCSHDDNPCCHIRTGRAIAERIRLHPTTQATKTALRGDNPDDTVESTCPHKHQDFPGTNHNICLDCGAYIGIVTTPDVETLTRTAAGKITDNIAYFEDRAVREPNSVIAAIAAIILSTLKGEK